MIIEKSVSPAVYAAPQLVVYGGMAELTAGGSSGMTEANPGGQCAGSGLKDPTRARC